MNFKAEYVKNAAPDPDNKHTCHWPGCRRIVAPAMWGCRTHWYALPDRLRKKIWATYRPGQEVSKTPSKAYVRVAHEVQDWIEKEIGV
jgi:hypothetical protein